MDEMRRVQESWAILFVRSIQLAVRWGGCYLVLQSPSPALEMSCPEPVEALSKTVAPCAVRWAD